MQRDPSDQRRLTPCGQTRREMLWEAGGGFIGTALTFLGINPFWEKAIQGAIILAALASDVALGRLEKNGRSDLAATSPA